MKAVLTGGTGYIGSHTCLSLIRAGYETVLIDNLRNSKAEVLNRIETVTGVRPTFYRADLRDREAVRTIFAAENPDSVIHFAGLKAVGESVEHPLMYYDNNVGATVALCEVMAEYGVKDIVFSSSATVYGDPASSPITEDFPLAPTNPYGRSKLMIETLLIDLYNSDRSWNISLLRYFNPVGADPSGQMGEDPNGIPNNLMPFIAQVAVGRREHLSVFGDDYPTPDGTGIRDYIHVVDLANGHLKAIEHLQRAPGLHIFNLGTGQGQSVLDVVKAFEKASGKKIPYNIAPRRLGDAAICFANPGKANRELAWKAELDINRMCEDSWHWQSSNPEGYTE